MIDTGDHSHASLGVETGTVVPAIATANGLTESSGTAIVAVDSGGPPPDGFVGHSAPKRSRASAFRLAAT